MSDATNAAHIVRRFLLSWAYLLFSLFIAEINVISDGRVLSWLPVGLISAALGAGLVLVYEQRRHRAPLSTVQAFITAAVLGLLLGFAQWVITLIPGFDAFRQPLLVIVASTFTIGLLGAAALLFQQVAKSQVQRRQEAIDEAISLAQAREEVADIAQRMQIVLTHDIDATLSPARASIEERLRDQERRFSAEEWKDAARQLRAAASETVGPLSRRLWVPTTPDGSPIGLAQIVRNVITKQQLQPRTMALVATVSLLPVGVSIAGWRIGLLLLAVGIAFIFTVLGSGNALMRKFPRQHAVIFVAAAVFVQAGHLLIPAARELAGASPYSLTEFLVASVIGIVLIVLTSSFGTFRSYREDVARSITAELDSELTASIAASRQVAQLARESARILHGTVQTRLIACAVAIERAADTQDIEAFQAALHEAQAVLVDPTYQENKDDVTLIDEVQRKVDLWSGLCDITMDVDPQLATTTGRVARDVGRVVEEGLSNAIRHGDAGAISVSVKEVSSQIVVVIQDDGAGPQGGTPGLGSSLLDSVSAHWQLEPTAAGARLTVRVV